MKTLSTKTRRVRNTRNKIEHAIAAVLRFLGIYSFIHTLYVRLFKRSRIQNFYEHGAAFRPKKIAQLTPKARKIYADLQAEIRKQKHGHK